MARSLRVRARRALVGGALRPADVLVEDGLIVAVGTGLPAADADLDAAVLSPGFVDLHVHALDGAGTIGAAPDLPGLARALARRGVTGFLATTITAPLDQVVELLQQPLPTEGARLLGFHLEGPWLSAERAGAQPAGDLQAPGPAALQRLLDAGPPVILTLAPELPGALDVIRQAVGHGVLVALGHSAASYDQAVEAVDAGARHVTHCFNAMTPLHHREPGLVGAALDLPQVTVEVIADGVHLHPAVVRLLWRAVGPRRLCLVSDAVDLGQGGQAARLDDGTLAGSGIGLDAAVRNAVAWGIPLADALTMAATTPAAAIARDSELRPGAAADLVLLDDDLRVGTTLVGGERV